jgi:hypothetical protein
MPLEELEYVKFAERWHWTPAQVENEVPLWLIDSMLPIAAMLDEVAEYRSDKEAKRKK